MSKTKETKNTAVETSGVADAALEATFQALNADDRAEVLAITDVEERAVALKMLASLAASSTMATDVSFKEAKPEQENIMILAAGGIGLRKGTVIRAYLMGTHHIFSKELKANWKDFVDGQDKYSYNSYLKLRDPKNGEEFGIWSSPSLRILEKIPTHSATPALVKADPMVEITYVGLVEGKEVLKQQYGIELQKGDKSHVFTVRVADGVAFNAYVKGCINSLNSPVPVKSSGASSITSEEATRLNYEKLQALQGSQQNFGGLLAQ